MNIYINNDKTNNNNNNNTAAGLTCPVRGVLGRIIGVHAFGFGLSQSFSVRFESLVFLGWSHSTPPQPPSRSYVSALP